MAEVHRTKTLGHRAWRWVLVALAVLVLAVVVYKTLRLWGPARRLVGRAQTVLALREAGLDKADLPVLAATLEGTSADLARVRGEFPLLLAVAPHLGWLPGVGGEVAAAPALLDVAVALSGAGEAALEGGQPLLALIGDGTSIDQPPLALLAGTLSDGQTHFETAQALVQEAVQRRADVDTARLSPRVAGLVEQLDAYLPLLQAGMDGALLAPDLLGANGARTYMVVALNNDELRAGGGFISAVGLVTVENGTIGALQLEDSYAVDDFSYPYPDPPEPLRRYMGLDLWVFRDGNWSPDFPTSAQAMLDLYYITRSTPVDGLIALDQVVLLEIVSVLQPLQVGGWPEPITRDNFDASLHQAWSPPEGEDNTGEWWLHRKDFMGDLVTAVRARVEQDPGSVDWTALGQAVLRVLDERHLQVWIDEPAVASVLREQGWDGAIPTSQGDFLVVVDTNMGYNKMNAIVEQRLDYRVLIGAEGSARAELDVQHYNPAAGDASCVHTHRYNGGYAEMVARCYWDYLRVYAPVSSALLFAQGNPTPAEWMITGQAVDGAVGPVDESADYTVFGTFLVVPRGQERETQLSYELPPGTVWQDDAGWHYRLYVRKQAGTGRVPLRVSVVLPPGAQVLSTVPAAASIEGTSLTFELALDVDREIRVDFQLAE